MEEDAQDIDKEEESSLAASLLEDGEELELLDISSEEERSALCGEKVRHKELLAETEDHSLNNNWEKLIRIALIVKESVPSEPGLETAEDALPSDKEREPSLTAHGSDGGEELNQSDTSSEDQRSVPSGKRLTREELNAETEMDWPQLRLERPWEDASHAKVKVESEDQLEEDLWEPESLRDSDAATWTASPEEEETEPGPNALEGKSSLEPEFWEDSRKVALLALFTEQEKEPGLDALVAENQNQSEPEL